MNRNPDGRALGAAAAWRWREPPPDPKADDGRRRRHGLLQAVVGGTAGGVLFWLGHPILAAVVWSIATVTFTLAMVSPGGAFLHVERFAAWLGHVVGTAVTYILLVPLFYGFFMIFGRLFRGGRRDKLERWFDANGSYWHRRDDPERRLEFYERQF